MAERPKAKTKDEAPPRGKSNSISDIEQPDKALTSTEETGVATAEVAATGSGAILSAAIMNIRTVCAFSMQHTVSHAGNAPPTAVYGSNRGTCH